MERIYAQSLTLPDGTSISGPVAFTSLGDIINAAMGYIFAFAGIGVLLMVIAAGYSMLTSAGNSKKIDAGKQRLTNAIIGFVIIAVAYFVTQIAGRILGYTQITDIFP